MTQEDKLLLLKDLSARLPYGVVVVLDEKFGFNKGTRPLVKELLDLYSVEGMKPYLRPMSSMTKEEKSYYEDRWFEGYHTLHGDDMVSEPEIPSYIDWLLENHFDFRGLIPKGLAIEVNEINNPYK